MGVLNCVNTFMIESLAIAPFYYSERLQGAHRDRRHRQEDVGQDEEERSQGRRRNLSLGRVCVHSTSKI